MDLRCKRAGLFLPGEKLNFRGSLYPIEGGIARGVSEEHAALLLQDPSTWVNDAQEVRRGPVSRTPITPPPAAPSAPEPPPSAPQVPSNPEPPAKPMRGRPNPK